MSKTDLRMTEGIQNYILHEQELLNIMKQDTENTTTPVINKETLTKMHPAVLYYYFKRASQKIADQKLSKLLPLETQSKLSSLIDEAIIEKIVTEVINGDNVIFKNQFLDAIKVHPNSPDLIYPNSLKVFNNNGLKVKSNNKYSNKEITKMLPIDKFFLCKKGYFMDLMTEFINTDVLFSESKQNNIIRFQYIVNTFFIKIRDEYVKQINLISSTKISNDDIIFMYKGGTPMKILFERYSNLYNTSEFNDIFKDYFKRSDSDYAFILNYNLSENEYNKIYYHITKISIYALKYIKKILLDNKDYILGVNNISDNDLENFCKKINTKLETIKNMSIEEQIDLDLTMDCDEFFKIDKIIGITAFDRDYFVEPIPELNQNNIYIMNNTMSNIEMENLPEALKNFIKNKTLTCRRHDLLITKKHVDRDEVFLTNNLDINKDNLDDDSYLFVTANENPYSVARNKVDYNNVPLKTDKLSFFLTRIKINLVFYYKTIDGKYGFFKNPSELIDLSISKQISYDTMLSYKNFEHKYRNYRYIYEGNTNVEFTSLSPNGFISDLNKIFFYELEYPWRDAKYAKRVYRFCYFLILTLKEKQINMIKFLSLILNYINSILNKLPDIQVNYNTLIAFFTSNDLTVDNFSFIESIGFINKNIVLKVIDPSELTNYNNFFNVFKVIFEKTLEIENNKSLISEFSFSKFTIPDSKIIEIKQLGGN
jgi:hypothetical protein